MGSEAGEPLDEREMQTWIDFLRVATFALDQLDHELRDAHGLSLADYEILVALSDAPKRRLLMSELADRALVSSSRLTYRVQRLEADGLVRREPCEDDGRRVWAVLTATGFRRLEAAYPTHLAGVRRYIADPPRPGDRSALNRSLSAMLDALEEVRDVRR